MAVVRRSRRRVTAMPRLDNHHPFSTILVQQAHHMLGKTTSLQCYTVGTPPPSGRPPSGHSRFRAGQHVLLAFGKPAGSASPSGRQVRRQTNLQVCIRRSRARRRRWRAEDVSGSRRRTGLNVSGAMAECGEAHRRHVAEPSAGGLAKAMAPDVTHPTLRPAGGTASMRGQLELPFRRLPSDGQLPADRSPTCRRARRC